MQFDLDQAIEVLEQTPGVLDTLLRRKSAAWLHCRIKPDTFSPLDVLGHLIYGEMTDWIPRARIILECRDARAFDPFDRFAGGPLIEGQSVGQLLDRFAELRRKNVAELRGFALNQEQMDWKGLHPALGAVTLRQLLATWAVHDLNHIAQVVRVIANEYTEEVGSWREYLSILK